MQAHRHRDFRRKLLQRGTDAETDAADDFGPVANGMLTADTATHRQRRIKQTDRARPEPEHAHHQSTPTQHQTQAEYRRLGRVDQVCAGKQLPLKAVRLRPGKLFATVTNNRVVIPANGGDPN